MFLFKDTAPTDIYPYCHSLSLHDALPIEELHSMNSAWLWRELRDAACFVLPQERVLWRLSVAPTAGPAVTAVIAQGVPGAEWFYDWAGGLIWLSLPPSDRKSTRLNSSH